MAAAPSIEALFNRQAIVENAVEAYFVANGIPAGQIFTSQSKGNMPDFCTYIQYQPGGSLGHQTTRPESKTGWPELNQFSGIIVFTQSSDRAVVPPATIAGFKSLHDQRLAQIQKLMLRGAINGTMTGITPLNVPYHRMQVQVFGGQTPTIELDRFDENELGYQIELGILPEAWPANA